MTTETLKIEKTIRKQVLMGNGEKIRALLLTTGQIELIKFVEHTEITASELSHIQAVSIANASGKLSRLFILGYIERVLSSHETGGKQFIYSGKKR